MRLTYLKSILNTNKRQLELARDELSINVMRNFEACRERQLKLNELKRELGKLRRRRWNATTMDAASIDVNINSLGQQICNLERYDSTHDNWRSEQKTLIRRLESKVSDLEKEIREAEELERAKATKSETKSLDSFRP